MKTDRTVRLVTPDEKTRWNAIVDHPLQSWEWGEFRSAMGLDVLRLGVYEKNTLIQGWQVTFHPVPHTSFTVGYFPKGPAPTQMMISELIKFSRPKHAIFIQLEPNVLSYELLAVNNQQFVPSHRPLFTKYTFVLDLTRTEEELLSAMHNKTRYNIRVAQKHGVVVKEDNSDIAFSAYLSLSEETTQRQKFYAHNQTYHQKMWETLQKAGIAHLFTATLDNSIIAAWIVFVWKDTIYYPYGASSREHRETMAPTLLLWEIVRWGKLHGYQSFDLWGALGPVPNEHDPWFGFHRFKQGFAPQLVEFLGSFDLVLHPWLYRLYTIADTVRWWMLKK